MANHISLCNQMFLILNVCQLLQLTTQHSGNKKSNIENFQQNASDKNSNVKYDPTSIYERLEC